MGFYLHILLLANFVTGQKENKARARLVQRGTYGVKGDIVAVNGWIDIKLDLSKTFQTDTSLCREPTCALASSTPAYPAKWYLPTDCLSGGGLYFSMNSKLGGGFGMHSDANGVFTDSQKCSIDITGKRFDPGMACSASSHNPYCSSSCVKSSGTPNDYTNRAFATGDGNEAYTRKIAGPSGTAAYSCSASTYYEDPYACEVGDWSGKFGKLTIDPKQFAAVCSVADKAKISAGEWPDADCDRHYHWRFYDPYGPGANQFQEGANQFEERSVVFQCSNSAKTPAFCGGFYLSEESNPVTLAAYGRPTAAAVQAARGTTTGKTALGWQTKLWPQNLPMHSPILTSTAIMTTDGLKAAKDGSQVVNYNFGSTNTDGTIIDDTDAETKYAFQPASGTKTLITTADMVAGKVTYIPDNEDAWAMLERSYVAVLDSTNKNLVEVDSFSWKVDITNFKASNVSSNMPYEKCAKGGFEIRIHDGWNYPEGADIDFAYGYGGSCVPKAGTTLTTLVTGSSSLKVVDACKAVNVIADGPSRQAACGADKSGTTPPGVKATDCEWTWCVRSKWQTTAANELAATLACALHGIGVTESGHLTKIQACQAQDKVGNDPETEWDATCKWSGGCGGGAFPANMIGNSYDPTVACSDTTSMTSYCKVGTAKAGTCVSPSNDNDQPAAAAAFVAVVGADLTEKKAVLAVVKENGWAVKYNDGTAGTIVADPTTPTGSGDSGFSFRPASGSADTKITDADLNANKVKKYYPNLDPKYARVGITPASSGGVISCSNVKVGANQVRECKTNPVPLNTKYQCNEENFRNFNKPRPYICEVGDITGKWGSVQVVNDEVKFEHRLQIPANVLQTKSVVFYCGNNAEDKTDASRDYRGQVAFCARFKQRCGTTTGDHRVLLGTCLPTIDFNQKCRVTIAPKCKAKEAKSCRAKKTTGTCKGANSKCAQQLTDGTCAAQSDWGCKWNTGQVAACRAVTQNLQCGQCSKFTEDSPVTNPPTYSCVFTKTEDTNADKALSHCIWYDNEAEADASPTPTDCTDSTAEECTNVNLRMLQTKTDWCPGGKCTNCAGVNTELDPAKRAIACSALTTSYTCEMDVSVENICSAVSTKTGCELTTQCVGGQCPAGEGTGNSASRCTWFDNSATCTLNFSYKKPVSGTTLEKTKYTQWEPRAAAKSCNEEKMQHYKYSDGTTAHTASAKPSCEWKSMIGLEVGFGAEKVAGQKPTLPCKSGYTHAETLQSAYTALDEMYPGDVVLYYVKTNAVVDPTTSGAVATTGQIYPAAYDGTAAKMVPLLTANNVIANIVLRETGTSACTQTSCEQSFPKTTWTANKAWLKKKAKVQNEIQCGSDGLWKKCTSDMTTITSPDQSNLQCGGCVPNKCGNTIVQPAHSTVVNKAEIPGIISTDDQIGRFLECKPGYVRLKGETIARAVCGTQTTGTPSTTPPVKANGCDVTGSDCTYDGDVTVEGFTCIPACSVYQLQNMIIQRTANNTMVSSKCLYFHDPNQGGSDITWPSMRASNKRGTTKGKKDYCISCGDATGVYACQNALKVVCNQTELGVFTREVSEYNPVGRTGPEAAISANTGGSCRVVPKLARLQECTKEGGCEFDDSDTWTGCDQNIPAAGSCSMALGGHFNGWRDVVAEVNYVPDETDILKFSSVQVIKPAEVQVKCVNGTWETDHFRGIMPRCINDHFLAGAGDCWFEDNMLDKEPLNSEAGELWYNKKSSTVDLADCFTTSMATGYKSACQEIKIFNPVIKDDETTFKMPCSNVKKAGAYPSVIEFAAGGSRFCRWWQQEPISWAIDPTINPVPKPCMRRKYEGHNFRYCELSWPPQSTDGIDTVIIYVVGGVVVLLSMVLCYYQLAPKKEKSS